MENEIHIPTHWFIILHELLHNQTSHVFYSHFNTSKASGYIAPTIIHIASHAMILQMFKLKQLK
jgi:hypothetical protein